jgi:hypothetical protein
MQQAFSSEHHKAAAPKKGKNRKGGQAEQKRGAVRRAKKESTAEVEKGKNRKDGHVEQKRGRGARRAKKEPTAEGGVDKSLVERYRSKFLQHGLSKTKDS